MTILRRILDRGRRLLQPPAAGGGEDPFLRFAPPGHFYSPLPDLADVERRREAIFDRSRRTLPGIDLDEAGQLSLVEAFSATYGEMPFTEEGTPSTRYRFRNDFFSFGDAVALYSMIRHLRPRRIVEVGSGFSSAVMLDTNDLFFGGSIALTFVDPYPERLESLLRRGDRRSCTVVPRAVQDVPPGDLLALEDGDILFIDSSHVVKCGSDLDHLLEEVVPAVPPGVTVHFHDVFWPFEYPEEWVRGGRAWNENYALRSFLQFNSAFRVRFFNDFLGRFHRDLLAERLPLFLKNPGGSLWIRREGTQGP